MTEETAIIDESQCEIIEYDHKFLGDSNIFPLSGRYTGVGHVGDISLKFHLNRDGYHNVEGQGGKYSITGMLTEDGRITLFWHLQAKVHKVGKFKSPAKQGEASGSNSWMKFPDVGVKAAASKHNPCHPC
jgi:hypothetical protein